MIPVRQTVFGPCGNCYAACLASILELSIGEMPELRSAGDLWGQSLREWLAPRGIQVNFLRGDGRPLREQTNAPQGWSILGHRSGNRPVHAVVCRDGSIVHDPAPFSTCGPDSLVLLWTTLQGCP